VFLTGRERAGLAYDPANESLLLFGGLGLRTLHNDLWTWTGNTWTSLVQAGRPPGRQAAGMATDMARRRIVLFGGEGFNERSELVLFDDTWIWASSAAGTPGATTPPTQTGSTVASGPSSSRFDGSRPQLTSTVLPLVLGLLLIGAGYALRRR
jgi:hypothetical protein